VESSNRAHTFPLSTFRDSEQKSADSTAVRGEPLSSCLSDTTEVVFTRQQLLSMMVLFTPCRAAYSRLVSACAMNLFSSATSPYETWDCSPSGVCVLASNTPENCEVIADTGFTFKRGDVEDLRRMLSLLLSDERLRRAAGASGQQRIRENYLWEKLVGDIEAIYTGLVREEQRSSPIRAEARGRIA
jgi:Glycosyl transferases group 1